jgi:ArsR family transcriptional regulator
MSASPPVLSPRRRRPGGCCSPTVEPDVTVEQAAVLAGAAKALGDPTRLRIVDALRKSDPEAVCQCELLPLFAMSQAGLAKHLKVLVDAGILGSERRGTWTYYYMRASALDDLTAWLG